MRRVTIDYRHQGEQIRRYGPNQWDFTVTIEGDNDSEYHEALFRSIAKQNTVDWDKQPDCWYAWYLKQVDRLEKNRWRFIIERPYDD